MKVLVLTPGFVDTKRGWSVPGLVELFSQLKSKHQLDIYSLRSPPEGRGPQNYQELSYYSLGEGSKAGRVFHLGQQLSSRIRQYDLIWGLWIDRAGGLSALTRILSRKPLLLSVMAGELAAQTGYGGARKPLARLQLRGLLSLASRITVGSETGLEQVQALWSLARTKTRVCPLGLELSQIPLAAAKHRPGEQLKIVAVSNLQAVKQPELLIEIVQDLKNRGVLVRLDVFGAAWAEQEAAFHQAIELRGLSEEVCYRGFIEPAQLKARYQHYHCFLHASLHESQGLGLIEAAAAGLPLVTTKVGVAPFLGRLGCVVENYLSPQGAAEKILSVLNRGPQDYKKKLARHFSPDASAGRFERILKEAASCVSP